MLTRKLKFLLLLSIVGSLKAVTYVNDFSGLSELARWRFSNNPEFPGATGGITINPGVGDPFFRITYDKTPPTDGSAYNPKYVTTWAAVPSTDSFDQIFFSVRRSDPGLEVQVRIVDSSGQTFQKLATPVTPLGTDGLYTSWTPMMVKLEKFDGYWGGANDGVIRYPLRSAGFLLAFTYGKVSGYLDVDNLQFSAGEPSPTTYQINAQSAFKPLNIARSIDDVAAVCVHDETGLLGFMAEAGFKWIRIGFAWDRIEKVAGTYDFANHERVVREAQALGLRTLGILAYGNPIYGTTAAGGGMPPGPPLTPTALAGYKKFATETAKKFAPYSLAFEIWNEPDVPIFFGGTPNASLFAPIQRAGIDGVKEAGTGATVITTGMGRGSNYPFWDILTAAGAMAGANGWGVHPYIWEDPERRWLDLTEQQSRAKTLYGQAAGVWATEWGYDSTRLSTTKNNGVENAARLKQANLNARAVLVAWLSNVAMVSVYDARDNGTNPADSEHNFGLVTPTLEKKPTYFSIKQLITTLRAYTPIGLVSQPDLPPGLNILKLQSKTDATSFLYVVWGESYSTVETVAFPDPNATAVDLYGAPLSKTLDGVNSIFRSSLIEAPVYIASKVNLGNVQAPNSLQVTIRID